jgi:hypothetical protein
MLPAQSDQATQGAGFEFLDSDFGFVSDFDMRISDLSA